MRREIVGILICVMLLTTFFSVAKNVEDDYSEHDHSEQYIMTNEPISTSYDDDVPVWEVGNKWTYKIDDFNLNIKDQNISENLSIYIHGAIQNFPLEVVDTSGGLYQLEFHAEISGDYAIEIDFGDGPINITGDLTDTTTAGSIFFNKTNLGIVQANVEISGRLTVNVNEQPYFNLSFFPRIPIPATINVNADFDVPYTILDFPLNTSNFPLIWGLPATNITLNGTVQSRWLNITDIINRIILWLDNRTRFLPPDLRALSELLNEILPIVDIKEILEMIRGNNIFSIPEIPIIFMCNNTENITVPAGTFNAYDILVIGGLGNIYYAPEAKNIIKITGNFADVLPFMNNINAELISYEI